MPKTVRREVLTCVLAIALDTGLGATFTGCFNAKLTVGQMENDPPPPSVPRFTTPHTSHGMSAGGGMAASAHFMNRSAAAGPMGGSMQEDTNNRFLHMGGIVGTNTTYTP